MSGARLAFPQALWRGQVPFEALVWRHMLLIGTGINLLVGAGVLALLVGVENAAWAVALHFAPLPWNALLVASVWRHAQGTFGWRAVALAWFVATLVL